MEISATSLAPTPTRFPNNKLKKLRAKKMKIKSCLDYALSDESLSSTKKLTNQTVETITKASADGETPAGNRQVLPSQMRELRKQQKQDAEFYLTEPGIKAKVFCSEPARTSIFLEDIQDLILSACLKIYSPVKPRWSRLLRTRKISHTVVFSVDTLSSSDFLHFKDIFVHTCGIFNDIVELVPSSFFHLDISHFFVNFFHSSTPEPLKCSLPCTMEADTGCNKVLNMEDKFPRTQLLLSAVQMLHEDYPFPVGSSRGVINYTWSLPSYKDVTNNSPMFAVDCEMCLTDQNKNEVTRISIVDENHKVVLDTFVKPANKIINYLTRYSGVTEEMLENVKTSLQSVKQKIQTILPPDAILCGQSLNFDLHALEMYHPYVIDTSVIFNVSGVRYRKSSLKNLSSLFLKENIQNDPQGHCSVQDCKATLKLVQLKLQNALHFGDLSLDVVGTSEGQSIFPLILSHQIGVCVIGSHASFDQCSDMMLPPEVKCMTKESNEEIVKCTVEESINHNLTFSHLSFKDDHKKEDRVKFIDESIGALYRAAAVNALVVVIFNGCAERESNGLCMVKIKHAN